MVKINEYLESGALETYVLGVATDDEIKELLALKSRHPQIEEALAILEADLERIAEHMAITPPPNTWDRIETSMNELVKRPKMEHPKMEYLIGDEPVERSRPSSRKSEQFIEVEGESGHMRIRKAWRWVFAAVFVLGKIFLAFAIYYYLENKHTQEEIQQLKIEMRSMRR
ncbi:hypothetical protein AQ505_05615 [Pedobacter sp. PACM 27299]|uniref:hypothetical protein n=1 Tax=Pedobacter sp. PACM 27299 TaxID=1727164 RepID=UPI0007066F10|nr:hypothetical protein [Pedobacter sp. PACM 27299]ALL05017.1 hypothetical protein AQ505_05615 [Pedobacter sp. PACM 27299]